MKYAPLGKTGMEVSKITFGCWEMGGTMWEFTDDDNNVRAVRKALEMGINSFDSAEGYGKDGHSEEVLGKALGDKRKDVVLATKVSPKNLKPQDIRNAVTNSLRRLGTDYIDLYYIHWPNPEIPLEDTMGEMQKLKQEGLIRAIGASNFTLPLLKTASAICRIEAVQPEYSLLHRGIEPEILPWCIENDVAVMGYSSIAKGILTGMFHLGGVKISDEDFRRPRRLFKDDHMEKELPLINAMKAMADAKGIEMAQLAIAWLMHKEGLTSAIVGTQKEKHLLANISALDVALTAEEVAALDKISAEVLFAIDGSLGLIAQVAGT
jgi:aryl-alcohol dehydrogenase-like predicted oxidoreductase